MVSHTSANLISSITPDLSSDGSTWQKHSLETQGALLTFKETEHYGSGISVKMIDFDSKIGANPPFKSTYFEVLPGYTTPVDRHQVEECWIVLSGSGLLECDGERINLQQHDIVHFSSFKGHSIFNNSSTPLLLCSIYW